MKTVLAFSGGLDGFIAHKMLESDKIDHDLVRLSTGTPYDEYELKAISKLGIDLIGTRVKNIDLTFLNKDKKLDEHNIMIPGRNLFIVDVLAQMGYEEIYLNAVRGEFHNGARDKGFNFFLEAAEFLSKVYGKSITVRACFNESKVDLVRWYIIEHGGKPKDLLTTRSCLGAKETLCGVCNACVRRWGVFGQFGFAENYNMNPRESDYMKNLVENYADMDYSHYQDDRYDEVLTMLLRDIKISTFFIPEKIIRLGELLNCGIERDPRNLVKDGKYLLILEKTFNGKILKGLTLRRLKNIYSIEDIDNYTVIFGEFNV